jgi:hypothetical protein
MNIKEGKQDKKPIGPELWEHKQPANTSHSPSFFMDASIQQILGEIKYQKRHPSGS